MRIVGGILGFVTMLLTVALGLVMFGFAFALIGAVIVGAFGMLLG